MNKTVYKEMYSLFVVFLFFMTESYHKSDEKHCVCYCESVSCITALTDLNCSPFFLIATI